MAGERYIHSRNHLGTSSWFCFHYELDERQQKRGGEGFGLYVQLSVESDDSFFLPLSFVSNNGGQYREREKKIFLSWETRVARLQLVVNVSRTFTS